MLYLLILRQPGFNYSINSPPVATVVLEEASLKIQTEHVPVT